jgi:hypothetical protein
MKIVIFFSLLCSNLVFAQLMIPGGSSLSKRAEIDAKVLEARQKAAEERAKAATLRQEVESKRKEIEQSASKTE